MSSMFQDNSARSSRSSMAVAESLQSRQIDTTQPDPNRTWTLTEYGEPNIDGKVWGYTMRRGDSSWNGYIEKVRGEGDPDVLVLKMGWTDGRSSSDLSNVPMTWSGAIYEADRRLHREMLGKRGQYKVDDRTRHAAKKD